uniref:DDE superfamily endonuclease n=1 Tax=Candidatus Kentrum eta TaxID=2126337 RepID=A0A450UGB8_9GAMM|nr:MAG: hypothetical protein BECKH772A_GA0070896_100332 [Candidatus Kentron sp. H]VFJ92665.1 MAG: hypothetical protein BECKH772B_GA0070898_100322 [Candidatus Kentron sp. H]VFJ99455.1 MAG: hypothetical protein BECKH772C_GA0070978_100322 [Candidatus Kentron sp. H]
MFYDPFENRRRVDVADNHTAKQWAEGVRKLVQEDYPEARPITLLMDNLNTHTDASFASLYKTLFFYKKIEK